MTCLLCPPVRKVGAAVAVAPLKKTVWRLGTRTLLCIPWPTAPASTPLPSSASPCDASARQKTFPSSSWAIRVTWSGPERSLWRVSVKGPPVQQPIFLNQHMIFFLLIALCVCLFPQRAELALWCLTASSSRRRRRCSTTWPSCLRAWSARSASVTTGARPSSVDVPSTSAKRALPRRPGASWTGWWLATTSAWRSECGPRAATTWPSSEVTHPAGPLSLKVPDLENSALLTVIEQQASLAAGKWLLRSSGTFNKIYLHLKLTELSVCSVWVSLFFGECKLKICSRCSVVSTEAPGIKSSRNSLVPFKLGFSDIKTGLPFMLS